MHSVEDGKAPGLGRLARIWAGIGMQSFGGGASTQLLIRRAFVDRYRWVGDDEFGRFWSLCQLTPGINLIALTILIGRKLGGPWGIVVSLAGLLLPSAAITCLLAAGFATVQHSATVHHILRGVVPATAGIMAVVALDFARPVARGARRDGPIALYAGIVLVTAGALAIIVAGLSAIVLLLGMALLGALLFRRRAAPSDEGQSG